MKLAADFRQAACEALRGKWPIAILIGLVAVLLGGIDNEDNMAALQKLIDQALANDSAK